MQNDPPDRFHMMVKKIYLIALVLLPVFNSCDKPKSQTTNRSQENSPIKAEKIIKIALMPFNNIDSSMVSYADQEIRNFYHFTVVHLDSQPLPEMAWYPPRKRYRADSLIIWLDRNKTESVDYIVGLTDKDISCTKGQYVDWGIFGYGYMPGSACVVSTLRLKRNADRDLLYERFAKVLLHEIGHNLGLDHCPTVGCMMEDAKGTIVTVDNEKKELCPLCRLKIQRFIQP
jgi:archaemetzincin